MAKRLNDDDDTEDPLERFAREPDDPTTGTSKQKKVSDSFTGEQDELIEEYFVEISGSWHRGTKCIIRAAKGCNNANEKLNNFEKANLYAACRSIGRRLLSSLRSRMIPASLNISSTWLRTTRSSTR